MKTITFRSEATPRFLSAAKLMSDAVGATLGPNGRTVILEQAEAPIATKDGVTVAKSVHADDKLSNLCIQLIRDAAHEAVQECGDGTTTTTILTEAIFSEGAKMVAAGSHPIKLKVRCPAWGRLLCLPTSKERPIHQRHRYRREARAGGDNLEQWRCRAWVYNSQCDC